MKRIAVILLALLLLACQPTPEVEAVVAPSGYEAAIQNPDAQAAERDAAPAHWSETIPLQYWDITVDADVSPDAIGATPVYESSYVAMDEIEALASAVKRGLLKNADACCEDGVMTKADWYRQIQIYADTPAWDSKTGEKTRRRSDEEVKSYTESLASFIAEAPIELEYRPFSPANDPIPDDAGYRLIDGSQAWMRCDSKSISVLYGAELFCNAIDQPESQVLEGDAVWGEPVGTRIEGVTMDQASAEAQALALLSTLSLDGFRIAKAEKARYINDYTLDVITVGYQIVLGRAEADYETAGSTIPRRLCERNAQAEGTAFRPDWDQELIYLFVDETGVRSFFWTHPTARPQPVNENVAILSFAEVQDAVRRHLKNCFSYEEEEPVFREWYAGRSRYLVDRIGLYFGIIPKKNDAYTFYYGPVWIVSVRTYPADADVPALPYTMYTQYLHINAIDGSLIGY